MFSESREDKPEVGSSTNNTETEIPVQPTENFIIPLGIPSLYLVNRRKRKLLNLLILMFLNLLELSEKN